MEFWKRILIISSVLFLILISTFAIFHFILYIQNKTFAIQIPYFGKVIRFGKIPESSFPKSIDESFTYYVTSDGQIARIPRYVDDMIVDSELNGDLYAHDTRLGERKLYYWQDETAYLCFNTKEVGPVTQNPGFIMPDTKEAFPNYHFVFNEYGFRGEQLLPGLAHFESDVQPGMPIKLILKNRMKNEDGAYDLVGIFLFTGQKCSNYPI